jgi:hypothetical protein
MTGDASGGGSDPENEIPKNPKDRSCEQGDSAKQP